MMGVDIGPLGGDVFKKLLSSFMDQEEVDSLAEAAVDMNEDPDLLDEISAFKLGVNAISTEPGVLGLVFDGERATEIKDKIDRYAPRVKGIIDDFMDETMTESDQVPSK
jgi:hypothetical protein